MRKNWWKVTLYCVVASVIAFELEVRFLLNFAIVTTEEGYVTSDPTRELIVYGAVFVAIVLIGGLVFFRRMTRREIAMSACVLAVINVVSGLLVNGASGTVAVIYAYLSEWDSFLAVLFNRLGLGIWLSALIQWLLTPFIFVPFGRREGK